MKHTKTTFFLILTLIFNFKNLNAQNDGWREVGYGNYFFTDEFYNFKLKQHRIWGDTLDNIFSINFHSKKNTTEIVRIDETTIHLVKETNYKFELFFPDAFGGFYFVMDEMTDFYFNGKPKSFDAIYHWNNHSERQIFSSNLYKFFYYGFSKRDGTCYAFGTTPYHSFVTVNGFLKEWNGKIWKNMDLEWNTIPWSELNMCSDNKGNLYVTGSLRHAHGCNLLKYDGSNWIELGGSTEPYRPKGNIYSIITDSRGNLYAAGDFKDEGGKHFVAKWDGKEWSELGTGSESLNANGIIYSLAIDKDGNIYAAGAFTNSEHKHYVAKWDGGHWSEVGGGSGALNANKPIYSIFVNSRKSVFATGEFTNEKHNRYVAVYTQP